MGLTVSAKNFANSPYEDFYFLCSLRFLQIQKWPHKIQQFVGIHDHAYFSRNFIDIESWNKGCVRYIINFHKFVERDLFSLVSASQTARTIIIPRPVCDLCMVDSKLQLYTHMGASRLMCVASDECLRLCV